MGLGDRGRQRCIRRDATQCLGYKNDGEYLVEVQWKLCDKSASAVIENPKSRQHKVLHVDLALL